MKHTTATLQLVLVDDSWYFQKNDNGTIFDEEFVGSHLTDEDAIRCVRNAYCPEEGFEVVKMYGSYYVPPILDPQAAVMFEYFIKQAYQEYEDTIFDIVLDKAIEVINQDKSIQALLEIEDLENDDGVDFWDESFTNYDRLVLLAEDKYEIKEWAIKDTLKDRLEDIFEDILNNLPGYLRNTIELAGMYWNKSQTPHDCLTKWVIGDMMCGKMYSTYETMQTYDSLVAQWEIENFNSSDKDRWQYFMNRVIPEEYFGWPLRNQLDFFYDWLYEQFPKVPISEDEISQIQLPLSKKDFLRLDNSDFRDKDGDFHKRYYELYKALVDRWEDDQMTRAQCGYGDL